jgi:hypothetical protein
MAELRPYDPKRDKPRQNPDRSHSTEITRTVPMNGTWGIVPSLWFGASQPVDLSGMGEEGLAGFSRQYEQQHPGYQFPRFQNIPDADRYAVARSANEGATYEPLMRFLSQLNTTFRGPR